VTAVAGGIVAALPSAPDVDLGVLGGQRYKVGRLCAEISQDVLSGLMETGEQGK
jgi:hypothetical protein